MIMKIFYGGFIVISLCVIIQCDNKTTYICDRRSSCGCSSDTAVLARIIGGESVISHSWGWCVGLYRSNSYFCAGSLISSDLVLTAAHCINDVLDSLSKIKIIGGSNKLLNDDGYGQVRYIYEVFIHPNFEAEDKLSDIAVIRLSAPFEMSNARLAIVCLPKAVTSQPINDEEYPTPGTSLVVIGWGITKNRDPTLPKSLQQATVKAVASKSSHCTTQAREMRNATVQFCAGVPDGGIDTCQGDSGGPIMAFIDNHWQIMGVTSNGYGCALPGHSGIYTRVPYFIPFIERIKDRNQTIYKSVFARSSTVYTKSLGNFVFILLMIKFL